jgi:hypothetical protein
MRSLIAGTSLLLIVASSASAATIDPSVKAFSNGMAHQVWRIDWLPHDDALPSGAPLRALSRSIVLEQETAQPLHQAAVEHSPAYETRAKLHKYASFATLPLFATELALGQSLYDGSGTGGKRAIHGVVGGGITALFGLNTVTGLWNMFGAEGRQDKEGRRLRLVHGLLMMAADAGFVATTALTPDTHGRNGLTAFADTRSRHRNLAIASISVGTAGYLLMLLGNH